MAEEREVILKLKADTTGLEKGLDATTAGLSETEKQMQALDKSVESGTLSVRQMTKAVKEYQTIAIQAGKESPIGQQAIAKAAALSDELGDLNNQVKNLGHDGRNMQAAMQLGGSVLSGYTAFTSATALLGVENENVTKTIMKLQAAQAGLTAIEQLRQSVEEESFLMLAAKNIQTKVLTASTLVYNTVVGTSTGLMKVFKIALMSTGIGALVVGLGLLIANFDTVTVWVKKAIGYFSDLKNVMLLLLGPIGWVIMAYNALKETEEDLAAVQQRQREENTAAHKERLKQIDEEKKKKIAAADAQIKALTLEKETLEANGQASYQVTLEILEHEKMKLQAVLEANNAKIQSWVDYYQKQREISGLSEEEFIKQMKGRGIDFKALQDQAVQLTQDTQDAIQRAENEITQHKREEYEKRKSEADKALAEEKKRLEDWLKLQLELEQELTNLLLANMKDGAEKELAILMDKQGRERDALIAKYGENAELLEQLEIKQNAELQSLYDKFAEERKKKEDELAKELIDIRIENMQEGRDKELAALREKHRLELEEIRAKYGEQTELEKELLIKQKNEIAAAEADFDEQERQAKIAKAEETLATIQGLYDAMSEIVSLMNQLGEQEKEKILTERDSDLASLEEKNNEELRALENKTKKELANENLTAKQKEEIKNKSAEQKAKIEYNFAVQEFNIKKTAAEKADEIGERQFKRDKAMRLAQVGIDTASATVKAIAMFGPPPSPLGIAGIAAAGTIGGLQAAVIARQQFQSSAASISPPDFSDFAVNDSAGSSDSGNGSNQNGSQQNNVTTNTDNLINGGTSKVILSMVELNEMQKEMNQIESISTIK